MDGYIVHTHRYRETSLILRVFTRERGVVSLMYKGAFSRKAKVAQFQAYSFTTYGKGDLANVGSIEANHHSYFLHGLHNYCGMYANELIYRLLPAHEPYPQSWQAYTWLMQMLAEQAVADLCLRAFEQVLLQELGYALQYDRDHHGKPIRENCHYQLTSDYRFTPCHAGFAGSDLLAIAANDLRAASTRSTMRVIHHRIIDKGLHGKTLFSRQLLQELLTTA